MTLVIMEAKEFLERRAFRPTPFDLPARVAAIIERVRSEGDLALLDMAAQFDRVDASSFALEVAGRELAGAGVSPALARAMELAATNIRSFHRWARPTSSRFELEGGTVNLDWVPLERVGVYIPGGLAPYPSTVLMAAIPAREAGVGEIVVCTPPQRDGSVHPAVLYACRLAGVNRVFRAGGAGAVAAMALGTDTIPSVDKVVGPGNAYVTEAKRQLSGVVGIDCLAGPSELAVLVGDGCPVGWAAADLAAQAEHGSDAWAVAVCTSTAKARELVSELASMGVTRNVSVVTVTGTAQALELINELAPEHVELLVEGAGELAPRVRRAGTVFAGYHSPAASGDYATGPSHVLPTGGSARFSSGLCTSDYMRCIKRVELAPRGLETMAGACRELARAEGFEWHAQSIARRVVSP
ncbi:MAG: histidinol dehydrogenase [Bacillota bacterium]